ncbi:uncharacterized protein LOC131883035 [Tigriopus californicus]|uniref:uncharacterized protein LOC131883035 n=1 Tax=Tigriopus californicus TaxID=6832 RepID=UPI0027D9D2FC|nr:uncharacterized protein LOC131883035 [Tigriopus californicus]
MAVARACSMPAGVWSDNLMAFPTSFIAHSAGLLCGWCGGENECAMPFPQTYWPKKWLEKAVTLFVRSFLGVPYLVKMDLSAPMVCSVEGDRTITAATNRVRSHVVTRMCLPSGMGPKWSADTECHGDGGGSRLRAVLPEAAGNQNTARIRRFVADIRRCAAPWANSRVLWRKSRGSTIWEPRNTAPLFATESSFRTWRYLRVIAGSGSIFPFWTYLASADISEQDLAEDAMFLGPMVDVMPPFWMWYNKRSASSVSFLILRGSFVHGTGLLEQKSVGLVVPLR